MKLVSMNGGAEELYDIGNDISEQHQLDDQGQHQSLRAASLEWKSQLMDPIFLGLMQNNEYNELHPERFNLDKY
jgi:hypothetical protein